MAKIPQRNVNLANRLMRVATHAVINAELLTREGQPEIDLQIVQDVLLDGVAAIRDFNRKISPIELRGGQKA